MATPNHATHLTRIFPNLWGGGYAVIGPPSDQYNCIAYAAGDTSQHWEDDNLNSYWHPDAKRGPTTADLAVLFRKLGFKKCGGPRLEQNIKKSRSTASKCYGLTPRCKCQTVVGAASWARKESSSSMERLMI